MRKTARRLLEVAFRWRKTTGTSLSALELFELAFQGRKPPDKSLLLWSEDFPDLRYERLELKQFRFSRRGRQPVENCWVWCPVGSMSAIRAITKFAATKPMKDCNFYFFRIPDPASKLRFTFRGESQTAVLFSERIMRFNAKMVDDGNTLIIGENTYIGGGELSLGRTTVTVAAGGLWSDGVLLQGTDSHGVVDIDSMKIINNVPKHITLKRRVWLGRGASVLKNVTIEEGAIVGAAALVVKNVPKACAVAGVPAKIVKQRVTWTQRRTVILDEEEQQILHLREDMKRAAASTTPSQGDAKPRRP